MRPNATAQGEATTFERLYRRYFSTLKAGIRATYGSGPPDPEDVAQAAFAQLEARMRVADIKNPKAYVWIAARNVVLLEKRAEAVSRRNADEVRRRVFTETCDVFDPERIFTAREQLQLITEALAKMPERRRRIFILVRVHGLTLEEAGRQCGVTRTSAIRHVAIATELVAEALTAEQSGMIIEAAE